MEPNSNSNTDPLNAEQRIIELCAKYPDGANDATLQQQLPQFSPQQRLAALNRLLSLGRLDLLKSSQLGIVYRLKDNLDPTQLNTSTGSGNSDMDEKLIYAQIKESGNKGIWIRDIATKTNVKSLALNKALKSLETKRLIKSVQSVGAASKKKVYMLFDLEPDRLVESICFIKKRNFGLIDNSIKGL